MSEKKRKKRREGRRDKGREEWEEKGHNKDKWDTNIDYSKHLGAT